MKKLLIIIFGISFSCSSPDKSTTQTRQDTDNEELTAMHKADQNDRQGIIDWSVVSVRDSDRLARVNQMIEDDLIKTGKDHYHAAMIFQHGSDTIASEMAVKLMEKAIQLDSTVNKWLLAAAIDRDLMRRELPQIYGTQYVKSGEYEPWKRYTIDTTQVTDAERMAYRVETLAEQRLKEIRMNQKKISELWSSEKTVDEIVSFINKADQNNSTYDLSEIAINDFGYQLLQEEKPEEALKIFILNTQLYPDAANTHDSLGECLLLMGKKEEGIKAYQKSLELDPDNTNAKDILAKFDRSI